MPTLRCNNSKKTAIIELEYDGTSIDIEKWIKMENALPTQINETKLLKFTLKEFALTQRIKNATLQGS